MRCIVIFGPSVAGKATVGRELPAQTGFTLIHNHQDVLGYLASERTYRLNTADRILTAVGGWTGGFPC